MINLHSAIALAAVFLSMANAAATPTSSYLPQSSPTYLPKFPAQAGVITQWPPADPSAPLPSGALPSSVPGSIVSQTEYPPANLPVANAETDPNIIPIMKLIDWNYVPNATVTYPTPVSSGLSPSMDPSYPADDPYCWWTYNQCDTPKISYIPPDITICPEPDTWGLTYDDGPLYFTTPTPENAVYAEPNFYDFLLNHNNQKANLFYIASKILYAPVAAQRGLNDGHTICVHTWSHFSMTTLTNAQVVAEFYYSLRMIKQVLGITPKCWRPPYGDVDDRVRAIAWQMGLRTIVWDQDTDDWQIIGDQVAPTASSITYATANKTMAGYVANGQGGPHGHITLEHELSNATIILAESWLPTIQKLYKTMPATACNNIAQPYWEESFVYDIQGTVAVSTNGSTVGGGSSTTGSPAGSTPSISGKNSGANLQAMGSIMTLVAAAVLAALL
ncbi:hypothetical protein EMPS_03807 [Entomortierella parvispora]|uniref:NodB homology domain-containing protein n=1 Tax=Entomortierella parvispora TaxID=205924 RepID=A0A9P3H7H4_9FUNG|nr:hypothetical protein EMPS_03807 [Entomortierella parvispora]